MPLQTGNNYPTTAEQSPPPMDGHSSKPQKAARGTGGAGGTGGKEGGDGGDGHGPVLQAGTMHVVIQKHSTEDREIIEWASPLNFFPRQADTLDRHEPGTCQWLLRDSLYEQWKAGEIQALCCYGMPGAGKTILTSIVVHDLETNQPNETIGVAVLYLDHKEIGTQSPTNLLAAIWHQLVVAFEKPISLKVKELYRKHHVRRTRPSLEEIYSVLRSTVEHSSVFVVVDALDEYPEDNRDTLLRCLWKLRPAVRLMLTSRPGIKICHVIPNIPTLDVRATEEDILRYLDGQIKNSHRFQNHGDEIPNLRRLIKEKIVKQSDGMFLLAKLWIDPLMTEHSAGDVEDALMNLSSGLDDTYAGIVDRINTEPAHDKQLAWRTIFWVLNAKTPLQRSRLLEALSVRPGSTSPNPNRQPKMDIVLSVCAGLVVIDEKDDKVHLIHYTTELYLRLPPVQTILVEKGIDLEKASGTLRDAIMHGHEEIIKILLMHDVGPQWMAEVCHNRYSIGLYEASRTGNRTIVALLISHGANVNADGGEYGTEHYINAAGGKHGALQLACSWGNEGVVKRLLKHGTGFNTGDEDYDNALQEMVKTGRAGIIKLLLEYGGRVSGGKHRALETATKMGDEVIVKILLEHGTNTIDERHGKHGFLLQLASRQGYEGIVKSLLEHGADVNAYDTSEQGHNDNGLFGLENRSRTCSVLQIACEQSHEGIIRLLLLHGADVRRALQLASGLGHKAIVRLLLDHGADVDAIDSRHGSALYAASKQGHEDIVRLLIRYNANVNVGDDKHDSALYAATKQGHNEIVRLLLLHGAEIRRTGSVLQLASGLGHKAIVRLLLDHGAEVNAIDGRHGSALYAASKHGHEDIVRLLIRCGAVNAGNDKHDSALYAATEQGNNAIVRLLLLHCAHASSALQLASRLGEEAIVERLHCHDAEVDAIDNRYGRVLYAAFERGREGIARLLIALYATTKQGRNEMLRLLLLHRVNDRRVLQLASRLGHEAIVRLLLDHGTAVNARCEDALDAAVANGHAAIVELLLQRSPDIHDCWADIALRVACELHASEGMKALSKCFSYMAAPMSLGQQVSSWS
ncbi:ankyrin repeat-containing domain protein [Mycena olivaceomarginata]|nr:ankyrin repeat-containing domain protein [Mycena olivaceomarginata]